MTLRCLYVRRPIDHYYYYYYARSRPIQLHTSDVRCTTGVSTRPNSVPGAHRLSPTNHESLTASTHLRRWHPHYGSCRPADVSQHQERVFACLDDVASWMRVNRLQLNTTKTEVIWFAKSRRQFQLPTTGFKFGEYVIFPLRSVNDLGNFLDSNMMMRSQVSRTISQCFGDV